MAYGVCQKCLTTKEIPSQREHIHWKIFGVDDIIRTLPIILLQLLLPALYQVISLELEAFPDGCFILRVATDCLLSIITDQVRNPNGASEKVASDLGVMVVFAGYSGFLYHLKKSYNLAKQWHKR